MALKIYQQEVNVDILYSTNRSAPNKGTEQLNPNIFIDGGASIDIYGSNAAIVPTAIGDMTLNATDTNVEGLKVFDIIPHYLYFKSNVGTPTGLILSGVKATSLGAF